MLRGFKAIIYKELLQVRRDPSTRFVFLIPFIQTLIFGFAIDMDVQHIRTVVCDFDRSVESRRHIEKYANSQVFDIVSEVHSERTVREAIVAGTAKVGIIVPADFSSKLMRGQQATVQLLVDGSDSTVATSALQTSRGIAQLEAMNRGGIIVEKLPLDVRPRVLFNPDLDSSHFYVPGLVGIILQLVTVMLTAFAIVRERERGTLEQLNVTPVAKSALILGKIIPYAFIGIGQAIIALLIMRWVFGVPVEGDLFLLMSLSVLFLLPSLALGILISTLSENQAQAMQLAFLTLLPSVLLSGFAFPRETMPAPIYAISFGIPVTYYVQILRGIILRGAGFRDLWPQTLALLGFGIVLVIISSMRFQKRIS